MCSGAGAAAQFLIITILFNQANVSNRHCQSVKGRVLVWTTSLKIEYLTDDLTRSIPLYSRTSLLGGYGITFMVELDGFLTFDIGSFVRIIEVGPYEKPFFDASASTAVLISDTFPSFITSVTIHTSASNGDVISVNITHRSAVIGTFNTSLFRVAPQMPRAQVDPLLASTFVIGAQFKTDTSLYLPTFVFFQT